VGRLRARTVILALGCVTVSMSASTPASALQPISTFLARADEHNPDNLEARATIAQRDAEAQAALARLLPSFSARGTYTRNQYEVAFPSADGKLLTIQPANQLDAVVQLEVPVFDPAGYARYGAQRAQVDAARASRAVTRLDVQRQILNVYYQLAGAEALVASARGSVEAAQKNADMVRERRAAGVASDLDAQRAAANIERARQDLADAELTEGLARRNLETLTSLAPLPSEAALADDLHEEAPLSTWLSTPGSSLPRGLVAAAQTRAAERTRDASRLALLPTVTASAQERFSNAASFGGQHAFYTLSASVSWRFDFSLVSTMRAQDAAVVAARAREEKTARASEDGVHEAWLRVHVGIAKSRAARAQATAAAQAARLAESRYAGGAATQLDVIEAQRDAFGADAARVMADASLVASRVMLRLSAGRPVNDTPSRTP